MGNIYKYGECDHCHRAVDAEYTFIVHRDPSPIGEMEAKGFPVGKIAAHFCGYCGGYVELPEDQEVTSSSCNCENFAYQGWTYEEDDPRYWKEPGTWRLEDE